MSYFVSCERYEWPQRWARGLCTSTAAAEDQLQQWSLPAAPGDAAGFFILPVHSQTRVMVGWARVMAGHSRSKNGVASLAYVPAIHVLLKLT